MSQLPGATIHVSCLRVATSDPEDIRSTSPNARPNSLTPQQAAPPWTVLVKGPGETVRCSLGLPQRGVLGESPTILAPGLP